MSLFTEELKVKAQEAELSTLQGLKKFPRPKKVLLIFFLVALIPAYIAARLASQAHFQNQYRSFLIAARPSFSGSKPPVVQQIGVLPTSTTTYAAYAYIVNPNLELAAKDARYVFDFFSASGKKLLSEEGNFFLLPNQKKYLVAPRVTSSELITKATLNFGDIEWQRKFFIPEIKLTTPTPTLSDQFDPPALSVDGAVVNASPYLLSEARIVFLLFDRSRNLISVSQRQEFTLQPGERRTYKQLWPNLQTTRVASVQVIAESNSLDPKNLSAQAPGVSPAGDSSSLDRPTNE